MSIQHIQLPGVHDLKKETKLVFKRDSGSGEVDAYGSTTKGMQGVASGPNGGAGPSKKVMANMENGWADICYGPNGGSCRNRSPMAAVGAR